MKHFYRSLPGLVICCGLVLNLSCSDPPPDLIRGTLSVSPVNPRYFTDSTGAAVYLTGSHTWNNLVDMVGTDGSGVFDFPAYLDWLERYNHNFIRLWTWELMNWNTQANNEQTPQVVSVSPLPWKRTGPEDARDGQPKFNLEKFNRDYFERLRERVKMAEEKGIYVAVMLFEGWGLQFSPEAFENHPFHPDNNINGINGDLNMDGSGVEIHTLADERITSLQLNYVREVVETLNEFDNVLFEISNENHPPSTEWQYHIIEFIQEIEEHMPRQHPVGMTFQYKGGSNQTLFDSPAQWISPNHEGGYRDDPPPGKGAKVILTDTDHLWGIGGNPQWVWKSFLRGLNPIFMDPYQCTVLSGSFDSAWVEPLRKSMGYTLKLARQMDLIHMVPAPELSSSGYCLANKGREYLLYIAEGHEVTVDLTGYPGVYEVEWIDPQNGNTLTAELIEGDTVLTMHSPFDTKEAVLHLK